MERWSNRFPPLDCHVAGKNLLQYLSIGDKTPAFSSALNTLAPGLHPSNSNQIFAFALPDQN